MATQKDCTNEIYVSNSKIGVGYSSDKMMITTTNCLKNFTTCLIGKPQTILTFGNADDNSALAKDLGFGMSASAMVYPLITASVSFSYDKYTKDDRYSQTFNFLYQAKLGTQVLEINQYGSEALNPFGLAAYQAGPQKFQETCGNKFVIQEELGARLYVAMKLTFTSTEDKTAFSLGLGGKLDLLALSIKVQFKFKTMIEKQNINMNLAIAAYQDGGDVIRLSRILGAQSPDNSYYVIDCDIRNMAACQQVIGGIINYAKLDLINQVNYTGNTLQGYPSLIGNTYADYTHIGLTGSNSTVTEETKTLRLEMLGNYSDLLQERTFLENLLYNSKFQNLTNNNTVNTGLGYKSFTVEPSTVSTVPYEKNENTTYSYWTWTPSQIFTKMRFTLKKIFNTVLDNILLLESKDVGILRCYQDPVNCKKVDLAEVDYSIVNSFKKAYQIISICNNSIYGHYALPVSPNIYQENAKFEVPQLNQTLYSNVKFNITNLDTKEIAVSIFNNELTRSNNHCLDLNATKNTDIVSIYEGDFTNINVCAEAICPNFASHNLTGLPAHAIFIEIESPI